MLTEPQFYLAAVPAVVLYGLSKGGFSGIGLLAMPLMALVVSPIQAAAILLPVLLVQDAVTVYSFRKAWDRTTLRLMLPGGLLGIGLATLTAALVTQDQIRLAVGLLAIAFCLNAWSKTTRALREPLPHDWPKATTFAALSAYASFVIHAGGPPYNVYALPRIASRELFVGTSSVFFAALNLLKIVPYFGLGQFTATNLKLSAALIPVAIVANLAGIWLVRRIPTVLFFKFIYAMTFCVGLKLVHTGASAIWWP
jgi:uncharacterized protein